MNIPEYKVKIAISDVVTEFRQDYFYLADCPDINASYRASKSKLDGIALIFKDGKLGRYIENYRNELFHLGRLAGVSFGVPTND
jgi:hypothetical protein